MRGFALTRVAFADNLWSTKNTTPYNIVTLSRKWLPTYVITIRTLMLYVLLDYGKPHHSLALPTFIDRNLSVSQSSINNLWVLTNQLATFIFVRLIEEEVSISLYLAGVWLVATNPSDWLLPLWSLPWLAKPMSSISLFFTTLSFLYYLLLRVSYVRLTMTEREQRLWIIVGVLIKDQNPKNGWL